MEDYQKRLLIIPLVWVICIVVLVGALFINNLSIISLEEIAEITESGLDESSFKDKIIGKSMYGLIEAWGEPDGWANYTAREWYLDEEETLRIIAFCDSDNPNNLISNIRVEAVHRGPDIVISENAAGFE